MADFFRAGLHHLIAACNCLVKGLIQRFVGLRKGIKRTDKNHPRYVPGILAPLLPTLRSRWIDCNEGSNSTRRLSKNEAGNECPCTFAALSSFCLFFYLICVFLRRPFREVLYLSIKCEYHGRNGTLVQLPHSNVSNKFEDHFLPCLPLDSLAHFPSTSCQLTPTARRRSGVQPIFHLCRGIQHQCQFRAPIVTGQ